MSGGGYRYSSKGQYRTAIWYLNDEQKQIALAKLVTLEETSNGSKVYVDIESANPFYQAEEYHQKYMAKARGRWG
jgi:peptide-methionine (S)-S-oxide reductase